MVVVDFVHHSLTEFGIRHSLEHVTVDEVIGISDRPLAGCTRHIQREPAAGMPEINQIMLKEIAEHVTTDYALFVQWDGMAHCRELWHDNFFDYDYIGAPWPWEPEGRNIGNGGFSLRSRRLLEACLDSRVQTSPERNHIGEDAVIGVDFRPMLESEFGIKFAPTDLAMQFSYELGPYRTSFGFHGLWNVLGELKDTDLEEFLALQINFQGWNTSKWHHVLKALILRGRMDLYQQFLGELETHSSELLPVVAAWIGRDHATPGYF
jgi:hypothetical protein